MCKSVKSISKFKMLINYNTETSSRLGNACAYFLCHKGDKVQGDHVHSCSKSRLRFGMYTTQLFQVLKFRYNLLLNFSKNRSAPQLTHTSKTRPSVKSSHFLVMFLLQICYSIQTLSFLRGNCFVGNSYTTLVN